jgi:Queuine tRNA-ribosyltransferase
MGWDQTLIKIDEKGATFRSYVDGTIHHLTPERSVDIQRQLGADLIVGNTKKMRIWAKHLFTLHCVNHAFLFNYSLIIVELLFDFCAKKLKMVLTCDLI